MSKIERLSLLDWRILEYMSKSCGVCKYNHIRKELNVESSKLNYRLKKLISAGIVKKISEGNYEILYKTPFCYIFGSPKDVGKYIYIGLLGLRNDRIESEPTTAIKLLDKENIKVTRCYVLATESSIASWGEDILKKYSIQIVDEEEIKDIKKIETIAEAIIKKEITEGIVILDCTSLTKPATIAYYRLSGKYLTPLIYVYESKKEIFWLRNRSSVINSMIRAIRGRERNYIINILRKYC